MRLQLIPTDAQEEAAPRAGRLPEPMMLSWMGAAVGRLAPAGVRLGVFDYLAAGPRRSDEVAAGLGLDPHGTRVLLEGLAGFGLLSRRDGRFGLAEASERWLAASSPTSAAPMVALLDEVQGWIGGLEGALRTGEVADFHGRTGAEGWRNYLGLLRLAGRMQAPALVEALAVGPGPRRMLDVAGGPGLYSIALAGAHEGLAADVLELEPSAADGVENVEEAGLSDRVRYHVGDLFDRPWPSDSYDLILISHFLHCLPEARCVELLGKAAGHLAPGGRVAIHDVYIAEEDGELFADDVTYSLIYYAGTGGRCWPMSTYRRWLADAGLEGVAVDRLGTGAVLATGTRPACPAGG